MATVAGALAVTTVQSEESKHRPILAIPNYQGKGNIAIPSGVAEAGAERARYVRPLEQKEALDPATESSSKPYVKWHSSPERRHSSVRWTATEKLKSWLPVASSGVLSLTSRGPVFRRGFVTEISRTTASGLPWPTSRDATGWRIAEPGPGRP